MDNIRIIKDYIPDVQKMLENRGNAPELSLKSMPELNRKLWGIHRGKLILIAARTSNGKSALALQIAWDLAKQNKRVLFLSLEMNSEDMIERLFCNEFSVDNQELLHGKFAQYKTEFELFKSAVETMPLVISDCVGKTWKEVDELITELDPRPDVLIVDYIQGIRSNRDFQKKDIDDYLLHMREISIRENIAVILCSQINRAAVEEESKEPRLNNLKGSGNLEEVADICILLHWPYKYNPNLDKGKFKLIVEKNRNGRTGFIDVTYKPEFYRFEDAQEEIKHEAELVVEKAKDIFGGKVVRGCKVEDWQE
jgi:replicative DNA helicase